VNREPKLRLPWSLEVHDGCGHILDEIGYAVSDSPIPLHLARHIVAACNAHEAMLTLARAVEAGGGCVCNRYGGSSRRIGLKCLHCLAVAALEAIPK
jgi:hypothetical protein